MAHVVESSQYKVNFTVASLDIDCNVLVHLLTYHQLAKCTADKRLRMKGHCHNDIKHLARERRICHYKCFQHSSVLCK